MRELRVEILRGENAVGENLIEITDGKSRLLLEYGVQLTPTSEGCEVEMQVKATAYDGIFITHCHADHSGLLKTRANTQAVYMGKATHKILSYCKGISAPLQGKIVYMQNEKALKIGEIKVTPYLCDHSAYDSYMLLIEKGEERILYTGDFRSSGRKSFQALLNRLPEKVDVLITEGTNYGRNVQVLTEAGLEEKAVALFKESKRIFILQSTLNIDRTVTMYRAAKKTGKTFIQTLASAEICAMLKNIPEPAQFKDCYTYLRKGVNGARYEELREKYGKKLLSKSQIAEMDGFVMQVSSNALSYLQELAKYCDLKGSLLVYSMWEGYKEKMHTFLSGVEKLAIKRVTLHSSGHADICAIEALQERVNPTQSIFVHRER